MAKLNKDGKWTTFYLATPKEDDAVDMREIDPRDPELANDPAIVNAHSAGKLRLENDDQV